MRISPLFISCFFVGTASSYGMHNNNMVIKVRKRNGFGKVTQYRSARKVLTPKDIQEADRFSNALDKEIREIEKILLKKKLVTPGARKSDMLNAWYLIGTRINSFLK